MWRDVLALVVGLNALAGLAGFGLRWYRGQRRVSHAEYQERLRRENEELDRARDELARSKSENPP
jgi:hypothetical protein